MKHLFIRIMFIILVVFSFSERFFYAQGLDTVIVEKYYVSDSVDAAKDSNLTEGLVTYRIFLDLEFSYKLINIYGTPGQPLSISASAGFYNTDSVGTTLGTNVTDSLLLKNFTLYLDSWLTIGSFSDSLQGVLKTEDTDGSLITSLNNNDTIAGIPISVNDGLVSGIHYSVSTAGIDLMSVFGNENSSEVFNVTSGSWFVDTAVFGSEPENRVLIGQFTTDGDLTFELNISLETPSGDTIQLVSKNPVGTEIQSDYLIYPFPIYGCTNTVACNYDSLATIDDGSCLIPVINCTECINDIPVLVDIDGDGICDADDTGDTVNDIDGNTYPAVQIGNQIWMAENLKVSNYNDGMSIPFITNGTEWTNLSSGAYCWYNNDSSSFDETFGKLYNWYSVETGKLCPSGWGIPSSNDWTTLISYLGGDSISGGKLKQTGTENWINPNIGATNEVGFTALPGGYYPGGETFSLLGTYGFWWLSEETNINQAAAWYITNTDSVASKSNFFKKGGFSVRCLKDTIISDDIAGCTDSLACNYDSLATEDDSSCLVPVANCTECIGDTLRAIDTDGDGVCDLEEAFGCTDTLGCNYDSLATEDDGSCLVPVANCTECIGDTLRTIDTDGDGVCDLEEVFGCTDMLGCNYDSLATENDGSCLVPVANCTECMGDTLRAIDTDGDGICDSEDYFPFKLPYEISSVDGKCNESSFCIPLVAIDTLNECIGIDFSIKYNGDKVIPSGVVTVNNNFINPDFTTYFVNIDHANQTVNVSLALDFSAEPDTYFAGIGEVLCVEFNKNFGLSDNDSTLFTVKNLVESYYTGIKDKLVSQGILSTHTDTTLTGTITFWNSDLALVYDSTGLYDYEITDIYASNSNCSLNSTNSVFPDLNGNFQIEGQNQAIVIKRDISDTSNVMHFINGEDAMLVARVTVNDKLFLPSVFQMIAMDVNMDGSVSAGDISQINLRTVQLANEFTQAWNYLSDEPSLDWLFIDKLIRISDPAFRISSIYPKDDGVGYSKYRVPGLPSCIKIPDFGGCELPTMNCLGIMLGDIDGNFQLDISNLSLKNGGDANEDTVIFDLANTVISNEFIDIPVKIKSNSSVNSLDLKINMPHNKNKFIEVKSQVDYINFLFNKTSGKVLFTSYSLTEYEHDKDIFTLRFKVNDKLTTTDFLSTEVFINGNKANHRCTGINESIFEETITTSSKTKVQKPEINIYPNPAKQVIHVEVSENADLKLFDTSGKLLITEENVMANQTRIISVDNLLQGIYVLKIYNSNFFLVRRVFIEK